MWGIEFNNKTGNNNLPLITSQSFIMLAATVLILRIFIHYLLENSFNVKVARKEHSSSSLQFSYFYHLSIMILGFSELNWNMFDLWVWVVSYICIGMLRKAIYTINIQRQFLLNGYGYNNHIVKLLLNSIKLSLFAIPFSIAYILAVNTLFIGVMYKVISMLCFPPVMLAIDSLYLFFVSRQTHKHLVYFYNQNINGISPVYKIDLCSKIISYAIKCSHFFNLTLICSSILMSKMDFLDCMWMLSVLGALYHSSLGMIRSIGKYRHMNRFIKSIDRILKKVRRASDQICIICMQPLLNSHRLIPCGHLFHYKCLFQWIQTKQECPVCRVRINLNL